MPCTFGATAAHSPRIPYPLVTMNPQADELWRARAGRWPYCWLCWACWARSRSIPYLPAFSGIAGALNASPVEMQQTLSAYLFGFAFMNLFHGALADSFGRRPVVLWGIAMFTLASAGCALAQSIEQLVLFRALQGLSTGAGIVVSRAVIRDMFPPAQAQKVMSQVTIYFGVAPRSLPLWGAGCMCMPDGTAFSGFSRRLALRSGPPTTVFCRRRCMRTTASLSTCRICCGATGSWAPAPVFSCSHWPAGCRSTACFCMCSQRPRFSATIWDLAPTQFFWFFMLTISGIMSGAWLSGRLAGRIAPKRQIRHGFLIMLTMSLLNVAANLLLPPHVAWSMLPIAIFAFGWALMVPVVTLLVLDLYPERRGMASSLQAFVGSTANGMVAGVVVPLVMHSTLLLAIASLLMMGIGLLAWIYLHHRWPEIGRHVG